MTNDASNPSLGPLLVQRGVLTPEQLDVALQVQREEGGMLGEILTSRGWVSPLSIAAAVAKQSGVEPEAEDAAAEWAPGWMPLGTLLVDKGYLTDVELEQALAVQRDRGGFLGEILVENGWLSTGDLVLALAAQLGLDFDVEASVPPSDRAGARFEVLENADGDVRLLGTAETFMEATDFVFDEVLWQREAGDLEIVRTEGLRREVVWSFRPGDAAAHSREDMLSVFGYAVGRWEDKHRHDPNDSSVAAGR
jgi:hypothetical protein